MDSQKSYESNDVRFIALRCIVLELSACENSVEFPAESGCKANDLTRYKVLIEVPVHVILSDYKALGRNYRTSGDVLPNWVHQRTAYTISDVAPR